MAQDFVVNIKALFDATDVKNKVNQIQNSFNNLKLSDDLKRGLEGGFKDLDRALSNFQAKAQKGVQTKADAKGLNTSMDKVISEFTRLQGIIDKVKTELGSTTDLSKIIQLDSKTTSQLKALQEDAVKLKKEINDINTSKLSAIQSALSQIKSQKASEQGTAAIKLFNEGDAESALQLLDQVIAKQEKLKNSAANKTGTIDKNIQNLTAIRTEIVNAISEAKIQTEQLGQNAQNQARLITGYYNGILSGVNIAADGFHRVAQAAGDARPKIHGLVDEQANYNREVDQLQSRIQYFFGLNNAIQLVKRTLRSAVNTIKELDKAMTATAVVTKFSVGDMWAQLPEYTRRANELGVTTKEAYEAATLYYQQGLKTNEVMAISNETLKMARIAGLGAAEATDRMTNAIRGFNMEINETNAQRIDDVYSRLAAISASNVDEISTAMTKVASLANNANMEFETTAAFLAQIIETTRESAETAGTALKTVIARFSEVKELYSEGELRGEDEEGEAIDVNKISKALRTAGIDLNKYFLGEVGLDDIFIELASKWDSLTAVQQRYIATQAAGSRQQSRFIALMSNYARTQELVGEAYKANGAAATQFAKTQESLQSKLAKLKNAWDQFAMGILNSDLVKLGVDLLTGLLNTVNALTSGFGALNGGIGGVINTILKLGLAIGVFNLGKGLVTGAFGSLLGKGSFGSLMSMAMFGNKGAVLKGLAGKGGLGIAAAGFLNPLAIIGGKLSGGLQSIGGSIASSGGIIGKAGRGLETFFRGSGASILGAKALTGLIPILGAVAAGATAIWGAYKIWEKYTPEGQLKVAKKIAEKQQEIAQEAKVTADGYKQVQEEYQKYSDAVSKSTNKAERDTAIKEQNEYLLSLIKQDQTYARYLQSAMFDGGEIILTLDEKALADAADQAAKAATDAAVKSYFANANQYGKEAEVEEGKAKYLEFYTDSSELEFELQQFKGSLAAFGYRWEEYIDGTTGELIKDLPEELQSEYESRLGHVNAQRTAYAESSLAGELARRNQAAQARLGYQTLLSDSVSNKTLTSEVADSLATALGNIFKDTGELSVENFDNIIKMASGSSTMQKLLSIMSGDFGGATLFNVNDDEILKELGIDVDSDEFEDFANSVGIGTKELEDFIKVLAQGEKKAQQNTKDRLNKERTKIGGVRSSFKDDTYSTLELKEQILDSLINIVGEDDLYNLGKYNITDRKGIAYSPGSAASIISNSLTDEKQLQKIFDFVKQINLDDPIKAFQMLSNVVVDETTYEGKWIKAFAENLLAYKSDILSTSVLIKNNLPVAYNEVSDKVQELIEENKELTPENIEELAKESKVLKQLLDAGVVSAKALAIAFTQVGNGSTEIDSINQSILNVLDNVYTFKDLVDDVHNQIANFDEGIDYGEGVDFFSSKLNELSELVDNYEFGNERTERLWNLIFGTDYKTAWGVGEDYVREQVQQMSQWLENDAYNFFKENAGLLNITDLGEGILDWDLDEYLKDEQGIHTLDTLVNKFAKDLGITTDAAKMFIETFKSHGKIGFAEYIDDLSLNSIYGQIFYGENVHGEPQKIWSDEDLNIIAQAYNMGLDELKDKLKNYQQSNEGFDDFVFGGPLFGKNLYKQFQERATIANIALDQFIENGQLKIEELRNVLNQLGYITAEAQNDIISSMYADESYKDYLAEDTVSLSLRFKVASVLGVEFGSEEETHFSKELSYGINKNEEKPSAELQSLMLTMAENAEIDPTSYANILEFITGIFTGKTITFSNIYGIPGFKELPNTAKKIILQAYAMQYMGMPISFSKLNATLSNLGVGKKTRTNVLKGMASQISDSPIPFDKIEAYINSGGIILAEDTDSDDIMSAIVTCLTTGEDGSNTLDFPKLYAILSDLGVKNVFNALSYISSALTGVGIPMTLSGLNTLITNPDLSNMTLQEKADYFDAIKQVLLTYYSIPGNQINLETLAILCGLGSTIGTTDAEFYYGAISQFLLGYYLSGEHEVYFDLGTLEYLCQIGDKLEEGDRENFYSDIKEPLLTYYKEHAEDGTFDLKSLNYLCQIGNGLPPGYQEEYFKNIKDGLIIYYKFWQRLGKFNVGNLQYAATVASNLPENEVPDFYGKILTDLTDYYGNEANASNFNLGDLEYLTNLVSSAEEAGASSELIQGFYNTIFDLLTDYYNDETNASKFTLEDLEYLVGLTSDAEETGSTKVSTFFETLTKLLKDYYTTNGLNLGDIEPTLKPFLGENAYNQFVTDIQNSLPDSINKDIVVKFNTVTAEEAVEKILRTNLDPTGAFSSQGSLLNTIKEITTFITSIMPAEGLPTQEYYSQIYEKLTTSRADKGYGLDSTTTLQILSSVMGIYGSQLSNEILSESQAITDAYVQGIRNSGGEIDDIITTTAEDGSVTLSTVAGNTDLSGLGENLEEQFKDSALSGYVQIQAIFDQEGITTQIRLIPVLGFLEQLGLVPTATLSLNKESQDQYDSNKENSKEYDQSEEYNQLEQAQDWYAAELGNAAELNKEYLEDVSNQLEELQKGGNVDLFNRPIIDTELLKQAGWENVGEGIATIYSNTYSNEDETVAMNFTPIFVDENGNTSILSPEALQQYAEQVIAGAEDVLHLKIGATFEGEDVVGQAVGQAVEAAEQIHKLQESYYQDSSEVIEQSTAEGAQNAAAQLYNSLVNSSEDAAVECSQDLEDGITSSTVGILLYNQLTKAGYDAAYKTANLIQTVVGNRTYNIKLLPQLGQIAIEQAATGGIVPSYVSGSNKLFSGISLTGEEDPEIVWNKEKGYAYITGADGPEFRNLNAGDQVFNAEETKRILRNSKNNQLFGSHANGINTPKVPRADLIQDDYAPVSRPVITDAINDSEIGQWNIGDEENIDGGSDDSGSKWKNELDWLYNLLEDIAELERQQNLIQERHNQLLNDLNTNGRRLFELTEKELNNLKEQLANQQLLQNKRIEERNVWLKYARESGFGNYVWWNNKDQTLEIDWDKINAITDKDRYDQLKEIIDRLEQLQDQIDETESSIIDIEGQIQELENRYLQEFANFQQRVYDAIVNQYQEEIDHLSELNDTLNDTNASILESLQREIDLQRQIRDNTDTERNIRDMEARLAYLRRDTTGANENAIRELEQELEDAREGYTDTLIDQSIERLQQSNDDASEQRQQQIDLLTAQLDEWKEDGELWSEVQRLIEEGFDHDGGFLRGSELESILQRADSWRSMSEAQREVWANELIQQTNQVGAYLIKIAEGLHDLGPTVWSDLPDHYYRPPEHETEKGFVTGGLTHRTGTAWLDGTLNEPEYVLNAKQTDAFLRLADVLPAIFGTGGVSTTNLGGNMYVELNMNVGGISSDYDVDRLVERVKSDIMAAGAYRNVKAVNFLR